MNFVIGKDKLQPASMETKQHVMLRLLDHILQPSVFEDIRSVANSWKLEQNQQAFLKPDVVDCFLELYQAGMLPRAEVFVDSNSKHVQEAIKVFHLFYYAKDWDVFISVACWLRERINPGMFVYAITASFFHHPERRGVAFPAPYEIYPYLFINSDVINRAFMLKMTNAQVETSFADYWKIKTEKNVVSIDSRTTLRHVLSVDDVLSYFTEDIDLNTYMFYLHMLYPYWLTGEGYGVEKERRGEMVMYTCQQLLARLRLERLSHGMRDIQPICWDEPLKTGYWPKIQLHTGVEMPTRSNDTKIVHEYTVKTKEAVEDFEKLLRLAVIKGQYELHDGTIVPLRKPQDVEHLGRLLWTLQNPGSAYFTNLSKNLLTYATYNVNKHTYVPTATDMYSTSLRDPAFWRVLKRKLEVFQLFKKQLPKYTLEELDFPGVKVESVSTTELVTFIDTYDMDITNAVYLNETEVRNKKSDLLFVARQKRLNNHPFKVTINVSSVKPVDAVVRVFLGPKYDVLGRITDINDKRLDMIEIDTFLCKLKSGKNSIVRNSAEFQGVIEDRPWTRPMWDASVKEKIGKIDENWWWKARVGFPRRLLLPLGTTGGMELQLFVVVTPVHTGYNLPMVDMHVINERHYGRWSAGFDELPLGFPFDRVIDTTQFFTHNMKCVDVLVYHKEAEVPKDWEASCERRDDLSVLDKDLFV
ncbi:basic juvenile hormone-suppressible protein 1-like [Leguminivora glycinivorella]|uniref:basic juvenile hormone-suppressible protein 1-like n=1 Tax=Leguminivora glycinivorella TaxID=1035111 RepID=UPI00200D1C29|nr:basic juvenile hormone-suppressible protein 1-like [Leguminivora glycinivorella]